MASKHGKKCQSMSVARSRRMNLLRQTRDYKFHCPARLRVKFHGISTNNAAAVHYLLTRASMPTNKSTCHACPLACLQRVAQDREKGLQYGLSAKCFDWRLFFYNLVQAAGCQQTSADSMTKHGQMKSRATGMQTVGWLGRKG
eukprot:799569-Pelagomonas_calceolata.AAC.3